MSHVITDFLTGGQVDRTGSQTKQKQPPDGAAQKLHMEVSIASNNFCHRYISFNMVNGDFYPQWHIIANFYIDIKETLIILIWRMTLMRWNDPRRVNFLQNNQGLFVLARVLTPKKQGIGHLNLTWQCTKPSGQVVRQYCVYTNYHARAFKRLGINILS